MELHRGWAIQWFVYLLCESVTADSNIAATAVYIRSVARLCGWADCQGFCQQRDDFLNVTDFHHSADRGCTTTKYNEDVQDALECPTAVCVTQNTFRKECTPNSATKTACFSLYLNSSTNRYQTRVCWDITNCMDLVYFCRQQSSFSCTSYGSTNMQPTFPTSTTKSPTPTDKTNPDKTSSKTPSAQPGATVLFGSPTAAPINGEPKAFIVGIVIGVCAAVIPIILGAFILLFMRKNFHRKFQVRNSTRRSESIEMADGPVYASIGPELPPKPPGSQTLGPSFLHLPVSSGITSSARSLHLSGTTGSVLLGNLQRNKSLPALACAVNSIPMESNEMLRAVAHNNQRSRSTSSPQSPDILADQVTSPHHDGTYRIPSTSQPVTNPSRDSGHLSPDIDNSRVISARDSGRGLTNKLYSEAVLPGPPSTYSTDETIPHGYVNLSEPNDHLLSDSKSLNTAERKYASIEHRPPGSQKQDAAPTGGQYMGVGSGGAVTSPSAGQYMGLVECGPEDSGTAKLDVENNDELSTKGDYTGSELTSDSQYAGLDTGTMTGPTTNGYMGLIDSNKPDDRGHIKFHTAPSSDRAYMGLEDTKSRNVNQYMGIGDGSSECENRSLDKKGIDPPLMSGTGAYSELNLLTRDALQQGTYMGLMTEANETSPRKDSGTSASSYVDLDPNSVVSEPITKKLNINKAENQDRANIARRKYWKSKSTFQKRKPSEDGLNTTYEGLQPPQKGKKSFLFKGKKKSTPSGKATSEEEDSDLCLDFKISSPPPAETAKPIYFTLDANSSPYGRCNGNKTKHGWTNQMGRESQQLCSNEVDRDAIFDLDEPFRPRSKSQPIQQSSSQYEEYEMIEDN
ncbi:hypothetical protein HOLleu_19351 [Holothuria leucospilota]|uniref:MANSC domain-containing protein n=1 Tax=Holothuria leucospilota TaxID=206669 RepID=A0A9Q1BZJ6_HOLLE|nr:hypothetical protein HOLleu_19351 [Holothuria leucospilota]